MSLKKLITSQKQKKSCRSDFCGIFSTNCRFFDIKKEMKKILTKLVWLLMPFLHFLHQTSDWFLRKKEQINYLSVQRFFCERCDKMLKNVKEYIVNDWLISFGGLLVIMMASLDRKIKFWEGSRFKICLFEGNMNRFDR